MNTPTKKESENKLNKILCCWCFSTSKSESDSDVYLRDADEPYEFILEKLAIKKVPIRVFTLTGDLPKKRSEPSENSSSTQSVQILPASVEPSVNSYTSYYKFQETDKIDENISQTSKDRKSLAFDDNVREMEIIDNLLPTTSTRKTLTEKQSREMVANVLNKHSSLFTLDKDAVPKDPNHLPSNRTVVPSSVRHAIKKQERSPSSKLPIHETEIYADVHHSPYKKSNLKETHSSFRQDIDPSIQTTIDSLKYTQKPHLPGIPPKNQKSMKTSITDSSSEREFYTVAPLYASTESNVYNPNVGTNSKMFTNQNVKNACDYEVFNNKQHRASKERDIHFPFRTKTKQDVFVQQTDHWYPQDRKYVEYDSSKKVFTVPAEDEFHGPYHLRKSEYYNPKYLNFEEDDDDEKEKSDKPKAKDKNKKKSRDKDKDRNNDKNNDRDKDNNKDDNEKDDNKNKEQNTSRRKMVDEEQLTDVRPSPKQGQNLKWKIIVKHHQDKKSDGEADEIIKETTGTMGIPRRW